MSATANRSGSGVAPSPPLNREERAATAARLYERFGQPLESAHAGRFVAITPDGRTLLGDSLLDTIQGATSAFGPGNYVFKVGEGVVGRWR